MILNKTRWWARYWCIFLDTVFMLPIFVMLGAGQLGWDWSYIKSLVISLAVMWPLMNVSEYAVHYAKRPEKFEESKENNG